MDPIQLNLEAFKLYLRVDFDYEDAMIGGLLNAAIDYAMAFCCFDADMSKDDLPEPVKQAVYMIASQWYEQREDIGSRFAAQNRVIPTAAHRLLWLYREIQL